MGLFSIAKGVIAGGIWSFAKTILMGVFLNWGFALVMFFMGFGSWPLLLFIAAPIVYFFMAYKRVVNGAVRGAWKGLDTEITAWTNNIVSKIADPNNPMNAASNLAGNLQGHLDKLLEGKPAFIKEILQFVLNRIPITKWIQEMDFTNSATDKVNQISSQLKGKMDDFVLEKAVPNRGFLYNGLLLLNIGLMIAYYFLLQ